MHFNALCTVIYAYGWHLTYLLNLYKFDLEPSYSKMVENPFSIKPPMDEIAGLSLSGNSTVIVPVSTHHNESIHFPVGSPATLCTHTCTHAYRKQTGKMIIIIIN